MYLYQRDFAVSGLSPGSTTTMATHWISTVEVGPFHIEVGDAPPLNASPCHSPSTAEDIVRYTGALLPSTRCILLRAETMMSGVIMQPTSLPKEIAGITASYVGYCVPVVEELYEFAMTLTGTSCLFGSRQEARPFAITVSLSYGQCFMQVSSSGTHASMVCNSLQANMSQSVLEFYMDLFAAKILRETGSCDICLENVHHELAVRLAE